MVALLAVGSAASAQSHTTLDLSDGCTDPTGVTVVVDFTELGGDVEIGCADAPATGAEAITSAGFVDTRDASGMICAIDAQPDPCPEVFDGSYWSYWQSDGIGDWAASMEGADTTTPVPGAVEGWRYNDGTSGPGVAPSVVVNVALTGTAGEDDQDVTRDTASFSIPAGDAEPEHRSPWMFIVLAVGAIGVVAAVGIGLARRRSSFDNGPAGQD